MKSVKCQSIVNQNRYMKINLKCSRTKRLFHGKCIQTIFIHELQCIEKGTSEPSKRVSFLMHCEEWLQIICMHFSWYDVLISNIIRFFSHFNSHFCLYPIPQIYEQKIIAHIWGQKQTQEGRLGITHLIPVLMPKLIV